MSKSWEDTGVNKGESLLFFFMSPFSDNSALKFAKIILQISF